MAGLMGFSELREFAIKALRANGGRKVRKSLAEKIEEAIQSSPTIQAIQTDLGKLTIAIAPIPTLQADMVEVKSDVKSLQAEVHEVRLFQEVIQSDLRKVLDVVTETAKKCEAINPQREELRDHEARIKMTEVALKQHIANKKVHSERS
jgi:hypothetical protein